MALNFEIIGYVKNDFDKSENPAQIKKQESTLIIDEKYLKGLYKIELSEYIDVIFYFHKSDNYELTPVTFTNEKKGVFASRSPNRPSSIGVTTVKLIERNGNKLRVTGLDALNGTPILDIKSCDNSIFQNEAEEINKSVLKSNPRIEIFAYIRAGNTEKLLIKAAQIHGHYCPGLALGVMAASFAMKKIRGISDGLEDMLAITETNNCFSDGVQFVTGCTFGNNALIFKDIGKTAFTLTKRDGNGIRIATRSESKEYMRSAFEEFSKDYEKVVKDKDHRDEAVASFKKSGIKRALATLNLDFDKLFLTEEVKVQIPDYAPSHESIDCDYCGESIMATRMIKKSDKNLCIPCANEEYNQLDGDGIKLKVKN